jgi:hypothetical protein
MYIPDILCYKIKDSIHDRSAISPIKTYGIPIIIQEGGSGNHGVIASHEAEIVYALLSLLRVY